MPELRRGRHRLIANRAQIVGRLAEIVGFNLLSNAMLITLRQGHIDLAQQSGRGIDRRDTGGIAEEHIPVDRAILPCGFQKP
jgi:hypothetical protein